MTQGKETHSKSWKGKETDSVLQPPEGGMAQLTPRFWLKNLYWTSELWDFKAINFALY